MTKGEAPKKDPVRLGVSRIDISVIIGKNLSAEAVDKVKKLVTATYGLDTAAGDTLSVETYGATADYFGVVARELPVKNSEIILLLAVAVLAIFLFGPFKGFLKNLNEALLKMGAARQPAEGEAEERAAAEAEDKEDQDNREPEQQRAGIGGFGGGLGGLLGSQDDALNLGKIISKDNIEDVRLSLANEPPEIIAKVIQRLPPAFALTAVPQGKMAEVMKHFFATSFEKPEDIRAIMSRVKSRVEWSFGGAVRLGKMLQPVERSAQEEVLSFLRADHPGFAAAVESRLFRFTDLLNYDDAALKRIFRKVGAEPVARCMKGLPEDVVQQFNDKLGESITTLVANHLKTMVGTGGDSDAEMKILNAVEGLVKKGFIPPLEDVKQITK
jgi:hypothetical protein